MRRHYTAEQRDQLLDLVASGRSVGEAAAHLGIAPSTASYWVRRATEKTRQVRRREARRGGEPPAFARLVREHEIAAIDGDLFDQPFHRAADLHDLALVRHAIEFRACGTRRKGDACSADDELERRCHRLRGDYYNSP